MKSYYETHKERIIQYSKVYKRKHKDILNKQYRGYIVRLRKEILRLLGGKCVYCGYDKDWRALCIDHVNGGGSKDREGCKGRGYYYRVIKRIKNGSIDYQILCANCNQVKETERKALATI